MLNKDIDGYISIRLALFGSKKVGKTTIIQQLINKENNNSNKEHDDKLGIDIYNKRILIEGEKIKLQILDIPGEIDLVNNLNIYTKEINSAIFIYDISSKSSYNDMTSLIFNYQKICSDLKKKYYCLIFGNKCDLSDKREVPFNDINDYSIKKNIDYCEISAVDLENAYSRIMFYIDKLIREILYDNKIIPKKNFFDFLKYKYTNTLRENNLLLPSKIYSLVNIFVKTIYILFPLEDYIIQIINDINEFNKKNIYIKTQINTYKELKNHIYNLEIIKSKLIYTFKVVTLKYQISLNQTTKNNNNKQDEIDKTEKLLLENNLSLSNINETLLTFIKTNESLRKAIHYVIHDYIINFILDFNNEIILEKRLDMIIDKDINEQLFIDKYFCDYESKKEEIYSLFNDKYIHYISSTEMNQYYLFIKEIDYLFNYLSSSISNKSSLFYMDKGENALNSLKDYYSAFNKKFDNIKNDKVKEMPQFEIYKSLLLYGKNAIKFYKYAMKFSDINYLNKKDSLYKSIKNRLYLSIVYSSLDIKFDGVLYLYASSKLIQKYYHEIQDEFLINNNNDDNNQLKEMLNLFNEIKEKICPDIKTTINFYREDIFLEIIKQLKYKTYNSIKFYLFYNYKKKELIKGNNKNSNNSSSSNNITNSEMIQYNPSLPFSSLISKIYKTSTINLNNSKNEDNSNIRIKLYEIYSDSITYFKRKQYNMFFKCLSQKFNKTESLLLYDGKSINSLKINPTYIEEVLNKYELLPDDIAQLFNIIGIGIFDLYIKTSSKDKNIKLFKKQKKLAYNIFNAGLSDKLVQNAHKLDDSFIKINNLDIKEGPYYSSLEQIRNCLRLNICIISLFKNSIVTYNRINIIQNSFEQINDYPVNYPIFKINEYIEAIHIESSNKYLYKSQNIEYFINNKQYIPKNIYCFERFLPYSCIYPNLLNKKEYIYYINEFIDLKEENEFDLINSLNNYNNNNNKINDYINENNFKEKFIKNYNEAIDDNKEIFNLIFILENLNNLEEWIKKYDNQKGINYVLNPIYFDYISKYYNFKIHLYIPNMKDNTINSIKIYKIIDLGDNSEKNDIFIFFDKDKKRVLKIFFPLMKKDEIYIENNIINLELFLKNMNENVKTFMDKNFSHFSYFIYWQIIMVIKLIIIDEKSFENIDENIIDIYLNALYNLNLYEQIIFFINDKIKKNNITNKIKMKTHYYILLYNSYKKLYLYHNCIDVIKEYLSVSNLLLKREKLDDIELSISQKIFNYDNILYILKLNEKTFNDIYMYYSNNDNYCPNNNNSIIKNENKKDIKILLLEGYGIYSLVQIILLCEIEKCLKTSITKLFDYFICSKDAIFILGLLMLKNKNGENKYTTVDILKILSEHKDILYNKYDKDIKINLFKKIFNDEEVYEDINLYYYLENDSELIKINNKDILINSYSKFLDNINNNCNLEKKNISFKYISKIIKDNILNLNDIYIINIGGGNYPLNIIENESYQRFFFKKILSNNYLDLNIQLNSCNDNGKYCQQNINEKFEELSNYIIEYISEGKINDSNEGIYNKLKNFFGNK